MSTQSLSLPEFERRLTEVLTAGLESWVHQLLYIKRVYPRDTFHNSTPSFLGTRLFLNRHPDVVSYIAEAVKVAAPSIALGVAESFAVVITEQRDESNPPVMLESYALSFQRTDRSEPTTVQLPTSSIDTMQRGIRDLLLSVNSLDRSRLSNSDSISFFVKLHVPTKNKTCDALNEAFAVGEWGSAETINPAETAPGQVVRPLYRVHEAHSDMLIQFFLRRPSSQKRKRRNNVEACDEDVDKT